MPEPKIVLYPADESGCGLYRMIFPAASVAATGRDVACYPPGHTDRIQAVLGDKIVDGRRPVVGVVRPDADVIVFQRPLAQAYAEAIAHLKADGYKIVVELDDDFRAVHPSNAAYRTVHPRTSPHVNWHWLTESLSHADLVIASTQSIADRYTPHTARSVVIPNYVPAGYLTIPRAHTTTPELGWPGTVRTHPDDLRVVGSGVARAMAAAGVDHLVNIGDGDGIAEALGVKVEATGWVPSLEYPKHVARLSVGIAPLTDTLFNRGKSWLKPLEMAAVGVPCVMSPVGDYQRLADEHGIGIVASKPGQWQHHLTRLLVDHEWRHAESDRLRQTIADQELTIEANAWRWWDAWTSVL